MVRQVELCCMHCKHNTDTDSCLAKYDVLIVEVNVNSFPVTWEIHTILPRQSIVSSYLAVEELCSSSIFHVWRLVHHTADNKGRLN